MSRTAGGAPDPRREAIGILVRVEEGGWSDRLLASAESRIEGGRDRRFLHQLVMTTLRWQLALDPVLAPHVRPGLPRIRPRARAALRLAAAEALVLRKPGPIAVDAVLSALRSLDGPKAVGLVNAVLRRALEASPAALPDRDTLPPWLWRRWASRLGEETADALAAALNRASRPFLVARRDRGGRRAVAEAMAAVGVQTEPSELHPEGLFVLSGALQRTPGFETGDAIPVNEASALVARLAAPVDRGWVADVAAAPGGKAACLCQDAARVLALEVHPGRARLLARQLTWRAPEGRWAAIRANSTRPPLAPGSVSSVLVDAPCSGTGTLRRRPEIRSRLTPAAVHSCSEIQARILEASASLPCSGGALTYAVCSLEPEEGIDQVRGFLERHPEFEPVDPVDRLGPACRGLVAPELPALVSRPQDGDHDGFFAARLVRR